jgi:hypothetical protein
VALAGVALLGGLLIVAGNLLKKQDEVSGATPSPSATVRPLRTPSPTPSPRELAVVPLTAGPSPSPPPRALFGGWIRATADLPILSDSDPTAAVVGTLPAGALGYIDEQDQGSPELGWATIEAPDPTGWVATRANGKDLVKRYLPTDYAVSGGIWMLAAGPGGFVAIGNPVGRSTTSTPTLIYVSPDGAAWHPATEPPVADYYYPSGLAWGPAGWLLTASGGERGEGTAVWSSRDGDHWTSLGVLQSGYANGLTGSGLGYLLQTQGTAGFGSRAEDSWFSTDGIHWTESKTGLTGGNTQVTATAAGFYAGAVPGCCPAQTGATAAFSTDGVTWTSTRPNLFVVSAGSALLGIEPGPDGSGGSPLRGSFYRGQLGWRPIKDGDLPFKGAVVTSLVSDGRRATAFGWDSTTEASLAWTSDGGPFTRQDLPGTFGGPPVLAAAGEGGVVVVGNRPNSRGSNPIVWHQDASGSWEPEQSPVLSVAPEPSASDCGPPPTVPVAFVNLDHAAAAACYGDAPMTIRLWSSRCDGCFGGNGGTYDEAWLASPSSNVLYLSPVKWADNWSIYGVLSPVLATVPDPSWLDAWLEVTGHFDDPAATSCHWIPPPDQVRYYGGTGSIIDSCRQQFVVTRVRVVASP